MWTSPQPERAVTSLSVAECVSTACPKHPAFKVTYRSCRAKATPGFFFPSCGAWSHGRAQSLARASWQTGFAAKPLPGPSCGQSRSVAGMPLSLFATALANSTFKLVPCHRFPFPIPLVFIGRLPRRLAPPARFLPLNGIFPDKLAWLGLHMPPV